jgi:Holliday junction DNA helicase RuvB
MLMKLVGNNSIMSQLAVATKSAQEGNRSIPHMLLTGAAGCGKTSTARWLAAVTGAQFINIAPDSIKKRSDLFPILKMMDRKTGYSACGKKIGTVKPTILFIDEIHGLSIAAQEYLGIMMEEWCIAATMPETKNSSHYYKDESAKTKPFVVWVPEFTLVGATTNDGKLSKPFHNRFKLRFHFSPYNMDESIQIVMTHAERLNIKSDEHAAFEIARRGRGVGRTLVGLLERCRDMSIFYSQPVINKELAILTFSEIGIDESGLTNGDIKLLKTLYEMEEPVGINHLAIQLNESEKVLSETIEPYLIQRGLIARAPKGRVLTDFGRRYLVEKGYVEMELEPSFIIPRDLFGKE